MGFYLNNKEPQIRYQKITESPYYVDKTDIIGELIPLLGTASEYVCITRPRRFGKTVIASMIGAFFSKGCDTDKLFKGSSISKNTKIKQHQNKHNVIYIDFSEVNDECHGYEDYISNIKNLMKEDFQKAYPDIAFRREGSISEDLKRISSETGEQS